MKIGNLIHNQGATRVLHFFVPMVFWHYPPSKGPKPTIGEKDILNLPIVATYENQMKPSSSLTVRYVRGKGVSETGLNREESLIEYTSVEVCLEVRKMLESDDMCTNRCPKFWRAHGLRWISFGEDPCGGLRLPDGKISLCRHYDSLLILVPGSLVETEDLMTFD